MSRRHQNQGDDISSSWLVPHLPQHYPKLSILHIFVLSAFAVPAVILGFLGKFPEFFIAHRSSIPDIVLLTLVLTLGVPLIVVVGLALVSKIGTWFRATAQSLVHALLWGLIFLPFIKKSNSMV